MELHQLANLVFGVAAMFALGTTAPTRVPAAVQTFLEQQLGIAASRTAALAEGRAIAVSLHPEDDREVAIAGAVRIAVPPQFYASRLRDITHFKRGDGVLEIGRFSTPASIEDVADLTLDADDAHDLSRCRPGHCGVQLPANAIERFRRELPRQSAERRGAASRIMRQVLVDLVNSYRVSGDNGLFVYGDSSPPTSVAGEFKSLIQGPPALLARFTPLAAHLEAFPRVSEDDGDDLIYWSQERLGPARVLSVTHLAMLPIAGRQPVVLAAASKQIYSTHYFDASLGLTLVLEDQSDPGAMYLGYVNRSRVDVFHGLLGGIKRSLVRSRAREAIEEHLLHTRDVAERQYRQTRTPGELR